MLPPNRGEAHPEMPSARRSRQGRRREQRAGCGYAAAVEGDFRAVHDAPEVAPEGAAGGRHQVSRTRAASARHRAPPYVCVVPLKRYRDTITLLCRGVLDGRRFGLEAPQSPDIDDLATEVMQRGTEHCCIESIEEEKEAMTTNIEPSQAAERSPGRLVAPNKKEIVSFIDFLRSSPIQDAKVSPLLMTTRPGKTNDLLEVFDPVSEKKYSISVRIPVSHLKSQGPQLLHFAKNGWVIVSKGVSRGGDHHMFFLVNPFKNYPDGDVIALPPLSILHLKGVSFSSVPGSPDFMVLAAGASADGKVVIVQTWRIGDGDWKEECLGNDDATFLMASHSPVFLDGVFYFLDINGRLGVVDPNEEDMEWNVLEKPDQPIRGSDEVHTIGEWDYSYLVEWKRELVAILHECGDNGSIRIFKLDRSRMVWTELEGMEDAAVFWDKSNNALIARPTPGEDLCNKVYLPNYTETDDGGRVQAFYCLKERQYYPSFNAKEPLNAIWFQPNLEDVLGDVGMQSVSS